MADKVKKESTFVLAVDSDLRNAFGEMVSIMVRRHALPLADAQKILEKVGMTIDNPFSFNQYDADGNKFE